MGDKPGVIHGASSGGVMGTHPDSGSFPLLVGPATDSQKNTIQLPLSPILCWKVEDIRFAFDSSFVTGNSDNSPDPLTNPSDTTSDPLARPFAKGDIRDELKMLAKQLKANPDCPLSVFGHADPVGPATDPDGYNKALSGRRATSIYALLISATQASKAASLWQGIAGQENWGSNQSQVMQQLTGLPDGTSMSTLISSYLPKLVPPEFSALGIGPTNFLAQGSSSQGKGDYQGCSSFNPLLIFSQEKQDSFAAGANDADPDVYAARNLANAPNRRVMVLIFKKGSKVDPAKWPCPSASGNKSGCIKRFWSDGQTRRSNRLPDEDRKYADTKDTFACRFYDRLMKDSPCYSELVPIRIKLLDDRVIQGQDEAFAGLNYRLQVGELDAEGVATDGIIQELIPKGATSGTLTLVKQPDSGDPADLWPLTLEITDKLSESSQTDGAQARLNNLGFYAGDQITGDLDDQTGRALQRFQTLYKIADAQTSGTPGATGTLTAQTADKLKAQYGS